MQAASEPGNNNNNRNKTDLSNNPNLFFCSCLCHTSSKRLRARETRGTGKTVVTRLRVFATVDSVMNMASVGDLFAFVDVFAGDAVPCVAGWTPATLE